MTMMIKTFQEVFDTFDFKDKYVKCEVSFKSTLFGVYVA